MRIAVIGGGISGLTAAYLLQHAHQVTVFEALPRCGGHADTVVVEDAAVAGGRPLPVDMGFIICNRRHYPIFTGLLDRLGVATEQSDMSFSVVNEVSGMSYSASDFNGLFAQRRNMLRPGFWRMLWDIARFYRQAPALARGEREMRLGDYLEEAGFGARFVHDHLLPMTGALWSAPLTRAADFPARYLAAFMQNHDLLRLGRRPPWLTVSGGSRVYVRALQNAIRADFRTGRPVTAVGRAGKGLRVHVAGQGSEDFDRVILACHSDDAWKMLSAGAGHEAADLADWSAVLGSIPYRENRVSLHTDTGVMPARRRAWASWNVRVPAAPERPIAVSYYMNRLQNLPCEEALIVSLNQDAEIDPARVLAQRRYRHPVYDQRSLGAQQRWSEISGRAGVHFCGAYWSYGFHEDGARSAQRVADAILGQSGAVDRAA